MGCYKENYVNFCLESSRGCKRYHLIMFQYVYLLPTLVKEQSGCLQTLVTILHTMKGKEILKIIKNKNEIKNLGTWDIGIFKGQKFKDEKKRSLTSHSRAGIKKNTFNAFRYCNYNK